MSNDEDDFVKYQIQASPSKQVMVDAIVATEEEQAAAKEFLNWIVYSEIGQQMLGVYLTLTDWNGVSKVKNFVGLKNIAGVIKDQQFWTSLLLTFKYVIVVVLLVNLLAFGIAYLLTRGMKGQNFFRAGFFTPNLIGGIVLGYIWQLSGYMILIYVAGFMGLSEDVMEAAQIDGASGFVKLKNIILPLMMSSITICLFLTLSRAFMIYDVNLSLTAGAPYALRHSDSDFVHCASEADHRRRCSRCG